MRSTLATSALAAVALGSALHLASDTIAAAYDGPPQPRRRAFKRNARAEAGRLAKRQTRRRQAKR